MTLARSFIAALMAVFAVSATAATEIRIVRYKNVVSSTIIDTLVHERLIEQEAAKRGIPDVKVTTKALVTSVSANEAVLAGQLDIVWGGVQGFLGPNDKNPGVFVALGGFYSTDMWVVCHDPRIRSLEDITADTKISTNNLTLSPMVINLQMMADKKYGDPKRFQKNLVLIGGPAQNQYNLIASKSDQVHCSVPGTPFQNIMTGPGGAHRVASTRDLGLPNTASATWASAEWVRANPVLAEAYLAAVQRAAEMINKDPRQYVALWHRNDNIQDSLDNVVGYVKDSNSVWSTSPQYLQPWADFMHKIGILNNPVDMSRHIWRPELLK